VPGAPLNPLKINRKPHDLRAGRCSNDRPDRAWHSPCAIAENASRARLADAVADVASAVEGEGMTAILVTPEDVRVMRELLDALARLLDRR
jgi:hypothetical protein